MQPLVLILLCSSISVSVSLPVHLATQPGSLAPKVVKRGFGDEIAEIANKIRTKSVMKSADGVADSVGPHPNAIPDLPSMSNNNLPKFDGTAGKMKIDDLDETPLKLNRRPRIKVNGKMSNSLEAPKVEGATQAGQPATRGDSLKVETTAGRESVDANPNGNSNPPKEGEVKVEETKQPDGDLLATGSRLSPGLKAGLGVLALTAAGTIGIGTWHVADEKGFHEAVDPTMNDIDKALNHLANRLAK